MHTAAHILSSVVHNDTGALITGNQLGLDRSRIDFNMENFDRTKLSDYLDKANDIINSDLDVKSFYLPRAEAMKLPSVVKLACALPPSIDNLRIVKIGDFDTQADGGTHVKKTSEIGMLELVKVDNKGKNNRRIYFKLTK
jgi:misacylated tRNA(Ala) deacylase